MQAVLHSAIFYLYISPTLRGLLLATSFIVLGLPAHYNCVEHHA